MAKENVKSEKKTSVLEIIILIVIVVGALLFIFREEIFKSGVQYEDTCWQSEKDDRKFVCFKDDKAYDVVKVGKVYRYENDGSVVKVQEDNKGTIGEEKFEFSKEDDIETLSYRDEDYKKVDVKFKDALKSDTKFVVTIFDFEDKTDINNDDILSEKNATVLNLLAPRITSESSGIQTKDKKYYYLKHDEEVEKLKKSTLEKKQLCFKYDGGTEQTDFDVEPDYKVSKIEVYYCNR